MDKKDLLFYQAYEDFYAMACESKAFELFCKDAFGADFSQDGFSDLHQIDMILQNIPEKDNIHILDIGCGNGKMLGYLQKKTGAKIYGFDYSSNAIKKAKELFVKDSEFKEGLIGEIEYPKEKFDLITSMDTIYFARDMSKFVLQVMSCLKTNGIFFVGYQEGDVIPKTENVKTAVLSQILDNNNIKYQVYDITKQTYDLLAKKREVALLYKNDFEKEGHKDWFDLLMMQTECTTEPFDSFKKKMARYIYVINK